MDSDAEQTGADRSAVVFGANGGIGNALVHVISARFPNWQLHAAARNKPANLPDNARFLPVDVMDEASLSHAAASLSNKHGLDVVVVATGKLHDEPHWMPEKSYGEINPEAFAELFAINCTAPAIVAKHFLPLLTNKRRCVFAALSARVGSITDNRLGGWYGYRASKAALAMLIRTLAIELQRKNPGALCIGLHPGTVDTPLSAPFQSRVPVSKLFSAETAAIQLIDVISDARPESSGSVLAWDGQIIPP